MTGTIHPELDARRACDIADYCDLIIRRANPFGVGLGGPDGDPSPSVSALRAPSLSQDNREPAQPNKRAGRNHG